MNLQCRRFVANEYERGRDWERIEQLEAENKKARALLQETVNITNAFTATNWPITWLRKHAKKAAAFLDD